MPERYMSAENAGVDGGLAKHVHVYEEEFMGQVNLIRPQVHEVIAVIFLNVMVTADNAFINLADFSLVRCALWPRDPEVDVSCFCQSRDVCQGDP